MVLNEVESAQHHVHMHCIVRSYFLKASEVSWLILHTFKLKKSSLLLQ